MTKNAIGNSLDGLEVLIRGRSRYRFGWVQRVKSCVSCNGRAIWIDQHVKPDLWGAMLVKKLWRHAA